MAHTAVSTTVVCSLQSNLPTHQSANITVHCTQNKTVTIQLCQYQYPSSNWCIMNWNGHGRKWSWPILSTTATFA